MMRATITSSATLIVNRGRCRLSGPSTASSSPSSTQRRDDRQQQPQLQQQQQQPLFETKSDDEN